MDHEGLVAPLSELKAWSSPVPMHLLGFSKVALWVEVMLLHPPLSPHWVLAPLFHTSLLKVLLMNMSVWVCPTSTLKATGGCWIFWSWSYRSLLAA